MFRPGNGIGWILSMGECSFETAGWMSTSRVCPLAARYSSLRS